MIMHCVTLYLPYGLGGRVPRIRGCPRTVGLFCMCAKRHSILFQLSFQGRGGEKEQQPMQVHSFACNLTGETDMMSETDKEGKPPLDIWAKQALQQSPLNDHPTSEEARQENLSSRERPLCQLMI